MPRRRELDEWLAPLCWPGWQHYHVTDKGVLLTKEYGDDDGSGGVTIGGIDEAFNVLPTHSLDVVVRALPIDVYDFSFEWDLNTATAYLHRDVPEDGTHSAKVARRDPADLLKDLAYALGLAIWEAVKGVGECS